MYLKELEKVLALMILFVVTLIVIQAEVQAQSKSVTVSNTKALVGTELVKSGFALSLQPGDRWSKGTMWLVKESYSPYGNSFVACKGTYEVLISKSDDDVLVLRLYAMKKYLGTKGTDGIAWTIPRIFYPLAVDLEFNAIDGQIPDSPKFMAASTHFVADDGKPMTRYYDPDTFAEKIIGRGDVAKPRPDFLAIGDTLKMSAIDGAKLHYASDMPPGFKLRKKK